jgi:CheY-like chemotaxis protein
VDDDALSLDVLSLLLSHAGYAVDTAGSGDAALNRLDDNAGPPPDVVLADIQMPGITGSALARALRQRCGTATRLLAMSGSPPVDETVREFDGLLLKPFNVEQLSAAIATNGRTSASTSAVHPSPISLDETIYKKLVTAMSRERLQRLYALCVEDMEGRIARMRKSASNNEEVTFRAEAHAIKGGAGMVGAAEVQTIAATLEHHGLHDNHQATLDDLAGACERLRRILRTREVL